LLEANYKTGQASQDRLDLLETALVWLKKECREQRVEDWIVYRILLVMPCRSFIADRQGVLFEHSRISRQFGSRLANLLNR
jgi:hypothetical protein